MEWMQSKEKIGELYNEQIILHEGYRVESGATAESDHARNKVTQEAFQRISNTYENKDRKAGFIAEKMVKGFLTKFALDNGFEYEIIPASFDADMYYKVDFFVHLKKKARAVGVETIEKEEMNFIDAQRGVQFTVNETPDVVKNKLKQIDRVKAGLTAEDHIEDIILVSFPQDEIMNAYNTWVENGKLPGGPDAYLPRWAKGDMISNVLAGYVNETRLNEYINVLWGNDWEEEMAV